MPSGAKTRSRSNGSVLQLHEVLSADDFRFLLSSQQESQLAECVDQSASICRIFRHEEVGVLSCVRETEENRSRLADEQVPNIVTAECVPDLFGLAILKQ